MVSFIILSARLFPSNELLSNTQLEIKKDFLYL